MSMVATEPTNGTTNGNAIAKAPVQRTMAVDNSPAAYLLDTARWDQCYRIAKTMAQASLLPDHLTLDRQKKDLPFDMVVGNCFLIVSQALRWQMDPFCLPPETYVVGNKLGFQGKLVAAVVNARGGLKQRLRYSFDGQGDDLTITVHGTFEGEDQERTITLSVKQAKTANDMWRKDPEQKLVYSGVTKWARRHCPELMLGVMTDDDIERLQANNVGAMPMASDLNRLIEQQQPQSAPLRPIAPHDENTVEVDATASPDGPTLVKEESQDEPEPAPIADPTGLLDWTTEKLAECTMVGDVRKVETYIKDPNGDAPASARTKALEMCQAKIDEINGKRGSRSNK